jgi:predicted dehydrogenase
MKLRRPVHKKLKWGVAGLGRFTENAFIPNVSQLRRSLVNSVFSNSPERAQFIANKFGVPNQFSNYDDFLNSEIDAVYIGSANWHH